MYYNKKLLVCISVFVLLIILSGVVGYTENKEDVRRSDDIRRLLREADRIAREARTETKTEDRLRDALECYREVLDINPDNSHALTRLSLGYFTLAEAYLVGPEKKRSTYRKGYKYGLKGLKTNEEFAELYEDIGRKALEKLRQRLHPDKP